MKNLGVMFTNKTNDWKTPSVLYNAIMTFPYMDICPFQSKENYLIKKWDYNVYCNPPYSDIKIWVEEIIKRFKDKSIDRCILLVPSRTDTKWFSKILNCGYVFKLILIKGRLKFNDTGSAPFPSCIFILDQFKVKETIDLCNYDMKQLIEYFNSYHKIP